MATSLVYSSSPVDCSFPHIRQPRLFRGGPLTIPSSPGSAYEAGEVSPGFDASFQSSMSIGTDKREQSPSAAHHQPPAQHAFAAASPMQLSPAPGAVGGPSQLSLLIASANSDAQRTSNKQTATATTAKRASTKQEFPFLAQLFRSDASTSSSSMAPPAGPSRRGSVDVECSSATRPLFIKSTSRRSDGTTSSKRSSVSGSGSAGSSFNFSASAAARRSVANSSASSSEGEGELMGPPKMSTSARSRMPLPAGWAAKAASRQTASAGGLRPPPIAGQAKRASEPLVATYMSRIASSPPRMEIDDGSSPGGVLSSPVAYRAPPMGNGAGRSVSDSGVPVPQPQFVESAPSSDGTEVDGASDPHSSGLGEYFGDELSPIPQSRKRFLDIELSPTPGVPVASGLFPRALTSRRSIERAQSSSSSCPPHVARRRASAMGLNKRSTMAALPTVPAPAPGPGQAAAYKRHAQALNGKPSAPSKQWRRAYSVADAAMAVSTLTTEDDSSASASSVARMTEADAYRQSQQSYFATIAGHARASPNSIDGTLPPQSPGGLNASPTTGFRRQETKGKALPCFQVKEDGLMRITPETLNALKQGHFAQGVRKFVVIDCRFDYEFAGGHINGAINLGSPAEVETALLTAPSPADLPQPSTSEEPAREGKTILIFHCEYSKERAPTSAKHLRNQDRHLNSSLYPKIHYPEVYVLHGGFKSFYEAYPGQCVGVYRPMKDPAHKNQLECDMAHFRNQKRQFARASSFTYGQGQITASLLSAAAAGKSDQGGQPQPLVNKTNTFKTNGPPKLGSKKHLQAPINLARNDFVFPARPKSSTATLGGGQSMSAVPTLTKSSSGMSITEEEHEADSSFGTIGSSPGGGGDSPCPPSSKLAARGALSRMSVDSARAGPGPRPFARAQTSSILMFTR